MARDGFDLRIAATGKLTPLSVSNANNWSSVPRLMVFEPLFYLDGNGAPRPVLAARINVLSPRALKVWLRPEATFSDGSLVTYDDVARSLESASLKVTKDDEGVLIQSDDSATPLDVRVADAYIYRRVNESDLGTGGFTLAEQDEHHIVLNRRLPLRGHVSRASLIVYDSPQEALAHTLKGDADILLQLNPRWIELLEGIPSLRVSRVSVPFANGIAFNSARLSREERLELVKLLRNRDVRTLAFGDECSAPEGEQTGRPHVHLPGRKLDVVAFSSGNFERLGLAVARALGDYRGTVRVLELSELDNAANRQDFDLLTFRSRILPTNLAAQRWRTGAVDASRFRYSNPHLDAALDASDWVAVQRELAEDPPFAAICDVMALDVIDSRIKNVSSTRFWQNVVNWELAR